MPPRLLSTVTDSVGRARKLGGTRSKITRTGSPSSRSTSMRSPIWITTPPAVDSTVARSRVSCPVAGLVRTSVTVWPMAFSISFCGVSRSKSKFCSTMPVSAAAKLSVSGRICAETSGNEIVLRPEGMLSWRTSCTSPRPLL